MLSNELSTDVRASSSGDLGFMVINSLKDAREVAQIISSSGICPVKLRGNINDIICVIQFGKEVGLKIFQSLINISIINGVPAIWGDAAYALCQNQPDCEDIIEDYDRIKKEASCTVLRKGKKPVTRFFSKEMAITANLWGKPGPWTTYPDRMIAMRARGFALRDSYANVLKGVITIEEAQDYPDDDAKDYQPNKKSGRVVNGNFSASNDTREKVIDGDIVITDTQLSTLFDMIDVTKTKEEDICKRIGINSLKDMPSQKYEYVLNKLKKKYQDMAVEIPQEAQQG